MKTYNATISNNSAIVKCSENNETIYAVRYDNLNAEELEAIDYMTSEDLRHYVNRNAGVIVEVEEEVAEEVAEEDGIYVYRVWDSANGEDLFFGASLEIAKEVISEEGYEWLSLYDGDKLIWDGNSNTAEELEAL